MKENMLYFAMCHNRGFSQEGLYLCIIIVTDQLAAMGPLWQGTFIREIHKYILYPKLVFFMGV